MRALESRYTNFYVCKYLIPFALHRAEIPAENYRVDFSGVTNIFQRVGIKQQGTACAEVLVVGEKGGTDAKTVFTGLGVAFVYRFLMSGARLWNEAPAYVIKGYQNATISAGITPELLGVGYIIGTRIASMMLGGAFLSALV